MIKFNLSFFTRSIHMCYGEGEVHVCYESVVKKRSERGRVCEREGEREREGVRESV